MIIRNKILISCFIVLAAFFAISGCKKLDRPKLGDYPQDANAPGGPLKFYVAFDGVTLNPLMNAVDSVRANFPSSNPLTSIDGVQGKAVQGAFDKAIKYGSANDFARSTSMTIAMWVKNTPWGGGPEWLMSLTNKDYWHNSAIFWYFEDQSQGSTATTANMKLAIMDQWFEFSGANLMQRPLFDGAWHHLAIVYDETTSKLTYYFDGQAIPELPASLTDVKKDGNPRGPLKLTDASDNGGSLVVGGWNKQVGLAGPTDGWINGFTGGMDQVRLYGKALSASEVLALFTAKM
jgi:hypothetical protein